MADLPKTILSSLDANAIVYAITGPLHHTTLTPPCYPRNGKLPCVMCTNAVRLVLQYVEPKIIDAALRKMGSAVGRPNIDVHPSFRGDD